MYLIVWEYQVKPEEQFEFESVYSPGGTWAKLFKKSGAYLGTDLLRDETKPYRYLTIDRWKSKEDYEAVLAEWEEEYKALDEQCERLTESEILLGRLETVP